VRARRSAAAAPAGGFTLIELIVVLVIMTVVVALALPRLRSSAGVEVRSGARLVASALRQARGRAVAHGRETVLMLDLDRRRMALEEPGESSPPLVRVLAPGPDYELLTAESEQRSPSTGGIRFFPDGMSTGGRITVRMAAHARIVDVDWLTGRVRVLGAGAGGGPRGRGASAR